jgi:hypothetical protein
VRTSLGTRGGFVVAALNAALLLVLIEDGFGMPHLSWPNGFTPSEALHNIITASMTVAAGSR